jgi:adenylate cyclase class 2
MIDDIEFEAKFYPVNKDELRSKLKNAGAELVFAERLMRRVIYDHKFHPEFTSDFVRIRDEGLKTTMTAKTHSQTGKMKDEKEIEVVVDSYDNTIKVFKSMGFVPDKYQETLRESWILGDVHIDIDTWPGLEPYCEIESNSEDKIKDVSEKLGFEWSEHFVSNSMDMYADVYEIGVHDVLRMAETLTFENNPFSRLPRVGKIKFGK